VSSREAFIEVYGIVVLCGVYIESSLVACRRALCASFGVSVCVRKVKIL
jgi:hypothetical protein